MRHLLIAAIAVSALCTTPALAQDADSDARAALAERLVDATVRDGLDKALQRSVDAEVENSELPAEQVRWMQANMPEMLGRHMVGMLEHTEELYAERLTLEQLTALVAFYDTPQGREIAARQFDLSAEVGADMGPMLQAFLTDLVTKFCAAFECPTSAASSNPAKRQD